jgi:hypothetical protein
MRHRPRKRWADDRISTYSPHRGPFRICGMALGGSISILNMDPHVDWEHPFHQTPGTNLIPVLGSFMERTRLDRQPPPATTSCRAIPDTPALHATTPTPSFGAQRRIPSTQPCHALAPPNPIGLVLKTHPISRGAITLAQCVRRVRPSRDTGVVACMPITGHDKYGACPSATTATWSNVTPSGGIRFARPIVLRAPSDVKHKHNRGVAHVAAA